MSRKPSKAARRAALDRVLAAAFAEFPTVNLGECMIWLSYAIHRSAALSMARDSQSDPEEKDLETQSPCDEIESMKELLLDDCSGCMDDLEEEGKLALELDPGFKKPILEQERWPTDE